ncbi:MAG: DUF1761 domain-containing protein [bacterium]|nr:DUF1761 domain-containing protein [bacterium]
MNVEINYLAVFLAGLSSMVVGGIWYAKDVFGNTWAALAKVNMNKKVSSSDTFMFMGSTFVISLITAYVLAHVTYLSNQFFGNSFLQDALTTAFWVWLGFTAGRFVTHDMFEGRRKKLTLLSIGYEFVTIMFMALIIGLLKP